jgi:hypothetical protein
MHTAFWLFFVSCIFGIWVEAARGGFSWATGLSGVVLVECVVLAANRGRCPLTEVARRYSKDQRPNFDIYLPGWLARYNKWIFGVLFAAAEAYLILRRLQLIR